MLPLMQSCWAHASSCAVTQQSMQCCSTLPMPVLLCRALPHGTAFWIVDLGGMSLADLGSEAFQFFKRMSVEVGTYYPERLHRWVAMAGFSISC